jgi:hypothetical protein
MIDQINITSARYIKEYDENFVPIGNNKSIRATIDGQVLQVPLDPTNRHYAEILRQVDEGTLTIDPADEPE